MPWKFENVCLLFIDFSKEQPEIIDNINMFVEKKLVSEQFADMYSFDILSIDRFFNKLYKCMMERFYLLIKK